MEDAKYRNQLTSLINDLYGSCPEVTITMFDASQPPKNETAAAVTAIMGGGVEVNV